MTVLMVGDVVGNPGRRILRRELKGLKARFGAAAAVVNAENCAAGSGITAALAEEIFDAGAARQETVGQIHEALDAILEIQNQLIGGESA